MLVFILDYKRIKLSIDKKIIVFIYRYYLLKTSYQHKMFATLALGKGNEKGTGGKMAGHYCVNLKCDPEEAVMLRDIFSSVIPGYHMNKAQWNTVILDGSIPQGEIERMIDNSYMLVVSKMAKKDQASLLLHL